MTIRVIKGDYYFLRDLQFLQDLLTCVVWVIEEKTNDMQLSVN